LRQTGIDDARHQLLVLARRKGSWVVWYPHRWWPYQVTDPTSGAPFTEQSARELITALLESGHPLQEVKLRDPANKVGYTLLVPLQPDEAPLYIKLHLGSGQILCRSFHYSDPR
jgi:hypothetical protein